MHRKLEKTTLKQKGFTLIEVAVVLLIISLLSGAALWASSGKTDGARVTNLITYSGSIASDIRKYGTSGSYGTSSLNQVLIDNDKIPSDFTISGTTITHSLGGNFAATGKGANFVITESGLGKSVCVDLVTGVATGFVRLFVDTSATPPAGVSTGGNSAPIDVTQANTLCASATNNSVHLVGR